MRENPQSQLNPATSRRRVLREAIKAISPKRARANRLQKPPRPGKSPRPQIRVATKRRGLPKVEKSQNLVKAVTCRPNPKKVSKIRPFQAKAAPNPAKRRPC